jgi:hypothetical protein
MSNVIELFGRQLKDDFGGTGDDGFVIALAWALAAQGKVAVAEVETMARDLLAQSNAAPDRIEAFDRVLAHMRTILPGMLQRARETPAREE